ncbi:CoA transferase [Nocardia asteroides]|uniref:CoA transferase n=1 Tax=Nocardia asteroides TaxID=1824 RepID=UPI001E409AA0|nr:CoA transferase [Nocardia asteroides]UGT61724.1 CoA transferase [Nocardia asteroides]
MPEAAESGCAAGYPRSVPEVAVEPGWAADDGGSPGAPSVSALAAWARSGAMALTGFPGEPPLAAPGVPALVVERALERVARAAAVRTGRPPVLPGVGLLGERAACTGFTRNAPFSCGGRFLAVPARDGFVGLSLARPDDIALLPALVERAECPDPWAALADWARDLPVRTADERIALLGLPGGALGSPATREPVRRTSGGRRRRLRERPRVIDFSALWAGPLCAHLLTRTGAEVVKVESRTRPDGARTGPAGFYDLLHHGQRSVTVDFDDPADRDRLARLVAGADLVVEASRPRALRRLGLDAEGMVAAGVSWLSITARGRGSDRVGFGDDIAACAGLHAGGDTPVPCAHTPVPCGDALADPLTGAVAAAEAAEALLDERARLIDISMHDLAARSAAGPVAAHTVSLRDGQWWVECETGTFPVASPAPRTAPGPAPGTQPLESLL